MRDDTSPIRLAIVTGFGIALLASNIWVTVRLASVEKRFGELEAQLHDARAITSEVRSRSESSTRAAGRTLTAIREELQTARKTADAAVGQAKESADRHVKQLASEFALRDGEEKQHRQELQHLKSELSKVTDAASKADASIGEVKTEVVAVKNALEADRSAMEHTVADLRRVKGDLGVQSGLIATNARELAALKAFNDKNYFDVDLPMKKVQTIGGVSFMLKKADPKRLRFTVEVMAGDKRTEKRDRVANEPVQFMVNKTKGPYQLEVDDLFELVINNVGRNSVQGYLATPKGPSTPTVAAR